MPSHPASAAWGPLPLFQFRPRLESVDWRRLSTIDVDKVARELDVLTLQENITHITFCKVQDEKCPHCRSGADPLLLKLTRLAQLTIEYLLHSQEFLTSQLRSLEEQLRRSLGDREQSKELLAKQAGAMQLLRQECKCRKKIISAQQLMVKAKASCHQCHFCHKAFMSRAFLQSHLQGRHPHDSRLESKAKIQTDELQKEIQALKEQLQLTRSQLEAAQQAPAVTFPKEHDFLKLLDAWKEEEKGKLVGEIEKVKEMFLKELKELASKNSALEYQLSEIQKSNTQMKSNIGIMTDAPGTREDCSSPQGFRSVMQLLDSQESKWTARLQALQQEHEEEKGQLLLHIEKLQTSVIDDLSAGSDLYRKRVEELCRKFQEQNELIIAQRQQIKEFAAKRLNGVGELKGNSLTRQAFESEAAAPAVPANTSVSQTLQATSNLATPRERAFWSQVLEPEELSEEAKGRESEQKSKDKKNLRKALKTQSSAHAKKIKTLLERSLLEELENLGIDADTRGIPNDHLNAVMSTVESARHKRERQMANRQQIREFLERKLSCKIEERTLFSSDRYSDSQMDACLAEEVPKTIQLPPTTRQLVRQKAAFTDKMAVPKIEKNIVEHLPGRSLSTLMPLLSSEEEPDEDGTIQTYEAPELPLVPSAQSSEDGIRKIMVKSGTDWTDGSKTKNPDVSPKPTGTCMKTLTEKVEKIVFHRRNVNKPAGGINATEVLVTKAETQDELKCVDVDDDDWDISSLEEEAPAEKRAGKEPEDPAPVKKVRNAWGAL